MTGSGPARLFLASGLALACWLGLAWAVEMGVLGGRLLPHYLLRTQDTPALLLAITGLIGGALWQWDSADCGATDEGGWARSGRIVGTAVALFALLAWAGAHWLMQGYGLSRDEEVAQMGAANLLRGDWGRLIPPEWVDYRRALVPEFYSPFGADRFFTPAYLPLNSAWRALAGWAGDVMLAGPLFLCIGLASLWRIALRLFPERGDVVAVVMLLALGSTQLLATGMTAYAMTGHFALNMLWLALVLRGGALGHGAAGLVALALAGLHQWHFPLLFLGPFLLWFTLQRRWMVLAFHGVVLALMVLLWAKLWPALLLDAYGPPADVLPAAGVGAKLGSLVDRLEKWRPLLHIARFLAWNHVLLVPLAAIGLWAMLGRWRSALRGETVALPLALGALGMTVLAIDQGYGWGYRYLHGFIGSFALLAGMGWASLGWRSLRPLWISSLVTLACGALLLMRAQEYVAPYARAHAAILGSRADVVLVDARGGRYVTDLARGREGDPLGRPLVMNISVLDETMLDRLCDRGSVAIFDKRHFLTLGVTAVIWDNPKIARLRAHLAARGCGLPMALPRRD